VTELPVLDEVMDLIFFNRETIYREMKPHLDLLYVELKKK
jgi:hypothetical protein